MWIKGSIHHFYNFALLAILSALQKPSSMDNGTDDIDTLGFPDKDRKRCIWRDPGIPDLLQQLFLSS